MNNNLAYKTQPKHSPTIQPKRKRKLKPTEKVKFTPGEKLLSIFFVCIFSVCSIAIVSNYAMIYQTSNEIYKLETKIDEQIKENNSFEEKITHLSKPERILQIASEYGLSINEGNIKVIHN